jgi:hypothetical protein
MLNNIKVSDALVNKVASFLKLDSYDFNLEQNSNLKGYSIKKDGVKFNVEYGEPCDFYRALLHISQDKKRPNQLSRRKH